jgi:NADH dehydrogenase FAD-containing subunit
MKNIIILGAGYAGMMAALRLSHTTRKHQDVQVTLISASDTFVERIRLHEVAAGHPPKSNKISHMLRGTKVDFVQAWVKAINLDAKHIELQTESGKQTHSYDKLVYALGSTVSRDEIQGVGEHAFTLDPNSASLLNERLKTAKRVIVIGGGLTGIEVATEIAESHPNLKVIMLTSGKLGQNLSQSAQDYLHKAFAELGIEVREAVRVQAVEANHVVLQDASILQSDATVWAAGFKVSPLAKESGFAINKAGQILVDPELRSISHSDVFAAGDSIDFHDHTPLPMRMSCQLAMPLGAHVGQNLTAWVKNEAPQSFEFGYAVQCIGLGQNRGLVQMIHPDDSMKEQVVTGKIGSFVKKGILNFTMWSLKLERIMPAYITAKSIDIGAAKVSQQAAAEY